MQKLTQAQLIHLLGVTPMTITLWRKGTTDEPALPIETVPRGTRFGIRFGLAEVKAWLELYRPQLVSRVEAPCECDKCNDQRLSSSKQQDSVSPVYQGDTAVSQASQ